MPERIPQPPGGPPVVKPAFVLRCQYCREPHGCSKDQKHQRVSRDRTGRVTYWRCWHCYTVDAEGIRRPSVFKVVRQVHEIVRVVEQ